MIVQDLVSWIWDAWLTVLSAAFSGPSSPVAMSEERLQDWERDAINTYLSWKGGKGPVPYVNPAAKGEGKAKGGHVQTAAGQQKPGPRQWHSQAPWTLTGCLGMEEKLYLYRENE